MNASALLQVARLAGRLAVPAAGAVVVAGTVLHAVLVYKMNRSLLRYGTATEESGDLDWMG